MTPNGERATICETEAITNLEDISCFFMNSLNEVETLIFITEFKTRVYQIPTSLGKRNTNIE